MKTITVTAEDISQGQPWLCSLCPLALALSRAMGCGVTVGASHFWEGDDNSGKPLNKLPDAARIWRARYDVSGGTAGEPFEFEINLNPELTKV